jgi:hypothetical protein
VAHFLDSGLPEKPVVSNLSSLDSEILSFVFEHWPCSALELAKHFGAKLNSVSDKRRASTKYSYYLKKLVVRGLLFSKRFGNSLVVWPMQAEKLRVVHDILREK